MERFVTNFYVLWTLCLDLNMSGVQIGPSGSVVEVAIIKHFHENM